MSEHLQPARGRLLVRPVETAESLPGGRIVLAADTRERLTQNQVEVVAVGEFALCDAEHSPNWARRAVRKCTRPHLTLNGLRMHAHGVRAGDWVLVRPRSTIAGPTPERADWFVHQDDVLGIFHTEEGK